MGYIMEVGIRNGEGVIGKAEADSIAHGARCIAWRQKTELGMRPPACRGHRCLPSLRAVGSTIRKPACKPPAYKPRAGTSTGGKSEKKMKSIGEGETGGSGDGVRGKGGHRGIGKRRR